MNVLYKKGPVINLKKLQVEEQEIKYFTWLLAVFFISINYFFFTQNVSVKELEDLTSNLPSTVPSLLAYYRPLRFCECLILYLLVMVLHACLYNLLCSQYVDIGT